jgi:hypothetical protein
MAGPARGRQDAPKGCIRRKDIAVITVEPNDRIFPDQDQIMLVPEPAWLGWSVLSTKTKSISASRSITA